jgi:hypothetical protein
MVNLLEVRVGVLRLVASNLSARESLMHGLCQIYSRLLINFLEACCIRLSGYSAGLLKT